MPQPHPLLARLGRRLAVACLVALVLVAGSVTGGVPVLGSDGAVADAATVCGGSVGEGQIRVVIVVDPGPGGPGGPAATCLVVARGTTGAQLLAERSGALGVPRPRYADSGLLCGIDGHPATGCGERTASGYRYWAYFSGTSGSWVYGSGNPFIRRMADGDVEGWRFVDGAGTGQDPPPRLGPSGLFPPLAPPPPTVLAPVPGPLPVPGAAPAPPAAGTPVPGADAGSPGVSTPVSAAGGGGSLSGDSPPGAPATADGVNGGIGPGRYGSTASGTDTGDSTDADPGSTELAVDVAASSSSPAGPIGAVVAGLVIAALVVATLLRSRTRR